MMDVIVNETMKVAALQRVSMKLEQVECKVKNTFAPGVYMRELIMPTDSVVVGKTHKTEHVNIFASGEALISINGEVQHVKAGDTFVSKAGIKKALYIIEELHMICVFPTTETDLSKLEAELTDMKAETLINNGDVKALEEYLWSGQQLQ